MKADMMRKLAVSLLFVTLAHRTGQQNYYSKIRAGWICDLVARRAGVIWAAHWGLWLNVRVTRLVRCATYLNESAPNKTPVVQSMDWL